MRAKEYQGKPKYPTVAKPTKKYENSVDKLKEIKVDVLKDK
jgi:hypothetical protein